MATQVKNTFVGDGSTVFYSFTFPYIKPADVYVSIDSVITTEYSFANATTIQFNTAPSYGAKIVIYRDTDDTAIEAIFFPGSAIRARDLNDNFTQSLYVIQESNSEASDASDVADQALTAAENAVIVANQAAISATGAVDTANSADTKADTAISTANEANNASFAALAAAGRAETKADEAVATADEAKHLADGAVGDASTAISTANQALSTANQSLSTANQANATSATALSTANAASSKADQAVTTATDLGNQAIATATSLGNTAIAKADEAQEDADLAVLISSNALTIADGIAQSGEPFGQLYNASSGAAGSKVIDLGDLSFSGGTNGHFDNEQTGIDKYTCSEGTGTYNLGSV